jgi:hypothetical protein
MSPPSLIKSRNFYVAILIVVVITSDLFQAVRQARDMVPLAATTTGMRRKEEGGGVGAPQEQHEPISGAYDDTTRRRNKIAILLSYVPSGMWGDQRRMDDNNLDMVVNKACYAKIWGYDLIFNTTDYFGSTDTIAMARRTSRTNENSSTTTTTTSKPNWLEWGAWNRVPHMLSLLEDHAYDWVFYADLDLIIRDHFLPLESYIHELEAYRKTAASVILGVDAPGTTNYPFSSFALLMKNANFSHRVLHHWMEAAYGLCPNGNFPDSQPGKYRWEDSDQPGLWYALMKAHNELQLDTDASVGECDNATGLLAGAAPYAYYDKFQKYFEHYAVVKGTSGQNLANVPNDQPLLFSVINNKDSSAQQHNNRPLAVEGNNKNSFSFAYAFALHTKSKASTWYGGMPLQLQQCKQHLGCYANYTHKGKLQVGCNGVSYL